MPIKVLTLNLPNSAALFFPLVLEISCVQESVTQTQKGSTSMTIRPLPFGGGT